MKKKRPGSMVLHMLKMFLKKSDTVAYPAARARVSDTFRGMLAFEPSKCVGCKLCVRVCPASAISIEKVADKEFRAVVHLDKCIFCGQCVDSCNKGALRSTADFELASGDKDRLTVELSSDNSR